MKVTKETDQEIAFKDERPSWLADRLGIEYARGVGNEAKKERGQFFTPLEIARFMGGMVESLNVTESRRIRILDPGCGVCILSCSLIERLVALNITGIKEIEFVGYETDKNIIDSANKVLEYTKEWLKKKGIEFIYLLKSEDFIVENYLGLDFEVNEEEKFDYIISNPPYFKLSNDDPRVRAAKSVVNGQANIYSLFMAVASTLLRADGEMIFITPRSFTSGRYFKAFREYFFRRSEIERIHLFDSRSDAFAKDQVLQETMIMKCRRKLKDKELNEILVTTSNGISDLEDSKFKNYDKEDLIDLKTPDRILHLPSNEEEKIIMDLFKSWKNRLGSYNIAISTGPVVAFRAKEFILENIENREEEMVPLLWLHNVTRMNVEWPVLKKGKGQYIMLNEKSQYLLVANKNYILLRRFSSKDDKSRLVAAPYYGDSENYEFVGFENKLNYIYRPKGVLEENEIIGLSALLNSTLFDKYFRTFNGNVNVSATELRIMPMPKHKDILEIAEILMNSKNYSQENIDKVVNTKFNIEVSGKNEQNRRIPGDIESSWLTTRAV